MNFPVAIPRNGGGSSSSGGSVTLGTDSTSFTGTPTAPTPVMGDSSNLLATTSFVSLAIANIAGGPPLTLNTIRKLADAIGDDAAFSTTISNTLATKAPINSPNFTGVATAPALIPTDNSLRIANTSFVQTLVASLVGAAPSNLNTLQELAASINNDANFVTTVNNLLALKAGLTSPNFTGTPTVPTATAGSNTFTIANTAFVSNAIASLVGSAPSTLNTLKELADALNDDPNFASTMTTALGSKAPLSSPIFTGIPSAPTALASNNTTQLSTTAFVTTAINNLINGAPASLNTLQELAAAINNDPNFATTMATSLLLKSPLASPAFTGNPTAPTPIAADNSTTLSTTAYVTTAITTILGSTPTTLNTLQKLATAINNDPNIYTTLTNLIGTKAPLISPVFTGTPTAPTPIIGDVSNSLATTSFTSAAIINSYKGKYPSGYLGMKPVARGSTLISNTTILNNIMLNLEPGAVINLDPGDYGLDPGAVTRSNPISIFGPGGRYARFRPLSNAILPTDTFGNQQQAGSLIHFTRDSNTQNDSLNAFGYVRGLWLEGFGVEGGTGQWCDRTISAGGIMIDHFDEYVVKEIVMKALPLGGWMGCNTRAPRESRHINCYGWWNGTAPAVGPGQVITDLTSYRQAVGWAAWNLVCPPTGDQYNEMYHFGCKEAYAYGITLLVDSLAAGANTGTTAVGDYATFFKECQFECQGYQLPNPEYVGQVSQSANPADNIWVRNARGIRFDGCSIAISNSGGYVAGTKGGYASLRAGDKTNNSYCDNLVVLDCDISGNGPGIVLSQCQQSRIEANFNASMLGSSIPEIVYGEWLPNAAAPVAPGGSNPVHYLGKNLNFSSACLYDPAGLKGGAIDGWLDVHDYYAQGHFISRKFMSLGLTDDGLSAIQVNKRIVGTGIVDNSLSRYIMTEGGTVVIGDNQTKIFLGNTATIASNTIQFPANPVDRQPLTIWTLNAITSLKFAVASGSGQSLYSNIVTLSMPAFTKLDFYYEIGSKTWRALSNVDPSILSTISSVAGISLFFPSLSAASSATIPSNVNTIMLLGYAAAGDEGTGAVYTRVTTQPTHPGKFTSADGAFWELFNDGKPHLGYWGGKHCDPSAYLTSIENHLNDPLNSTTLTACTNAWTAFAAASYDCQAALTNAITYAVAKNTTAFLPEGHWYIATQVDPQNGIRGAGMDISYLWWPPGNRCFYGQGVQHTTAPWIKYLIISDLTLHGPLAGNYNRDSNGNPIGGTNSDEPVKVAYYQNVTIQNVRSTWSKDTGMFITWSGQVTVLNYHPEYTARDGMYAGGNNVIYVNGYYAKHIGDDILSAHFDPINTGINPPNPDIHPSVPYNMRSIHIENVSGINCKGVRVIGAAMTKISNVLLVRPYEHGGTVGGYANGETFSDSYAVDVSNYTVLDLIDSASIVAAGGFASNQAITADKGFAVNSDIPSTGAAYNSSPANGYQSVQPTQTNVVPGYFDTSTKTFVKPEAYYTKTGTFATVPRAGTYFVKLDLRIMQTLPNTANYSNWGAGYMFTGSGWCDPARTNHQMSISAISCNNGSANAFTDLDIKLSVRGMLYGLDLSSARYLSDVKVDMHAVRMGGSPIWLGSYINSAPQPQITGAFRITGYFDVDPYFEHVARDRTNTSLLDASTASGKWNSANGTIPYVLGWISGGPRPVMFYDVVLRNIGGLATFSGNFDSGMIGTTNNITFICQPNSGNLSDSNHYGIRSLYGIVDGTLIVEDSNPQSSTYGSMIYSQSKTGSSALPTTGFYFKGQSIKNIAPVLTTGYGQRYFVTGWKRLTTNTINMTEHVLNTDWVEDRDYVGSAVPAIKTGAYTLVTTDDGSTIEYNSSTAGVITLPNNMPAGFNVTVVQVGSAVVTFTPATGATLVNRSGYVGTAGQYAVVSLTVLANTSGTSAQYVLVGDGA